MKTLKEKANELKEKNSWIRKGVEKLMHRWAEESECEETISANILKIETDDKSLTFRLITGKIEIKTLTQYGYRCYREDEYFWNLLSIDNLKQFLANFEEAVNVIEKQIDAKLLEKSDLLEKILKQE